MLNALQVALSAQAALKARLETVAHNVANSGTPGFRAESVRFDAALARAGERTLAFAAPGETYLSRRAGGATRTGAPLDVAIEGDGFLALATPAGEVYTRDGRMRMTGEGRLVSVAGHPVLDAGGAPIALDPNGGAVTIASDGMIAQGGRQIGALGLFSIPAEARLTRYENSGVIPDRPAEPIVAFAGNGVRQGFLEQSNVEPVAEMARMMQIQRAFEGVTAALESMESGLGDAIKTLGSTT